MSAPQSTIYVCAGVDLNNKYEHSRVFSGAASQRTYFAEKVVKTFSAYTYIRREWSIKVEASPDQARHWDYMYFNNGAFDAKTYYYFINKIEYVNDSTVELFVEMDVIQTYLFDVLFQPCFIERGHVRDDTLGVNLVDEGLDLGELVDTLVVDVDSLNELCLMVMSTLNPNFTQAETDLPAFGKPYNGVFSGLGIYAVPQRLWGTVGNIDLKAFDIYGKLDSIITLWCYPKALIKLQNDENGYSTWDGDGGNNLYGKEDNDEHFKYIAGNQPLFVSFATMNNIEGYVPKNNKVLCYPYNFLYATNNSGGAATYHFEKFASDACKFKITGCVTPDATVRLVPEAYGGLDENYEQGLNLANFPTCAWASDPYLVWLAQNQSQLQMSMITSGLTIAGGVITAGASLATGNVLGAGAGAAAVVSGATQIGNLMAQKKDMDVQPPQARGSTSVNVNLTNGKQTFSFMYRSITRERAKMIDDYFTMYGYKRNEVSRPNLQARSSFTYIKTVGCHVTGAIGAEDKAKFENVFNNGVTFWADHVDIGDYDAPNDPTPAPLSEEETT